MMDNPERSKSWFTWYHKEEWQVTIVLLGLVIFFSRTIWISIGLSASVIGIILLLYIARLLEIFFTDQHIFPGLVKRYKKMKLVLHGHSEERSRIAMAILASLVVVVLCGHRIDLAVSNPSTTTPTDIYWILFLAWYALVCIVTTVYLLWLWRNWVRDKSIRIPLMEGLVSSLFFYHGLSKKERFMTFVAAFLLGGVPSYFAIRLSTDTPFGYTIACSLVVPVIFMTLGGAYYAKLYLSSAKPD